MKLYAIKDIKTGKLITGITSSPHTFEKEGGRIKNELD